MVSVDKMTPAFYVDKCIFLGCYLINEISAPLLTEFFEYLSNTIFNRRSSFFDYYTSLINHGIKNIEEILNALYFDNAKIEDYADDPAFLNFLKAGINSSDFDVYFIHRSFIKELIAIALDNADGTFPYDELSKCCIQLLRFLC